MTTDKSRSEVRKYLHTEKGKRTLKKLRLPIIAAILVAVQFYIITQYYFYPGWDAGYIWGAVEGNIGINYFSVYPNNLFLVWLYRTIIAVAVKMGFWGGYALLIVIAFQCIICQASGLMLYIMAKEMSGKVAAVTVYILYQLIVGLSPWISVPYSDATALIFPVTIFFLATRKNKARWFLIGLLSFFAYSVKPQSVIICIAAVIIMLRKPKNILFFASGLVMSVCIVNTSVSSLNIDVDSELAVSPAHYLMMGLNERTEGKYAEEDVNYAMQFSTYKERADAELDVALKRINKMGFLGVAKHMLTKTKNAFSDGTFFWFKEGHFVSTYTEEHSKFFRNLYYPDGAYYKIWEKSVNIIWTASIIMAVVSVAGLRKENKHIITLWLGLCGILAFNILFEERSRYIFCNVPLILLLTSAGLSFLVNKIDVLSKSSKSKV